MLSYSITKGLLLGLIAGILTTIFDSLYMLSPENIYIPYVYPFALVTFNVFFWSAIGFFAGFAQWLFCKSSANFLKKEHLCWIVFFLLPFALVYRFLGNKDTVGAVFEQLPYFDSDLALYLVLLFIASLLFFTARGRKREEFSPFSFVFAILTIILLFQFCCNLLTIPLFSAPYNRFIKFFQAIHVSRIGYFMTVYIAGIILIAVLYFTAFFKIKPVIERFATQHYKKAVGILLIIVFSFLSGAGILSYSLYAKEHTPVIAHGENTGVSKAHLVILIVLDTVRADHLSNYGYRRQNNKNLDEFARDALVFENCIAPAPWTLPSHASLFTGLYPTEHGAHGDLNREADWGPESMPVSKDCVTLAEIFKQNGYKTTAVVSNYGIVSKDFQFDQGFDAFDSAPNIGDVCRQHLFRPIVHGFSLLTNLNSSIISPYRPAEAITAKSLRSVGENGSSSFFLFINYMDAHLPHSPPPPYNKWFITKKFPQLYRSEMIFRKTILNRFNRKAGDEFSISQYDGSIAYLDDQLGKFIEQLKRWGLYDASLIIVTSDHGELFGEHGFYNHRGPMYQELMHIPLLIKFPFSTKVGREKKTIQLTDVFATILSSSGLPIPENVSGKPFGNSSSPAVGEHETRETGQQRVLYEGNYKYMHYERRRAFELYDLDKDPQEQNNLANIKIAKRQELEHKLREWIQVHKPRYALSAKESLSKETIDRLKGLGYMQ
jgi:arylsulfatase A-like enzyme